jgi:hypothetical protein
MTVYWLMFVLPALAAWVTSDARNAVAVRRSPTWIGAWLLLTLLIGYRFWVGGDWINYFEQYQQTVGMTFEEIIADSDPGYGVVNWLAIYFDWNIFGVNLFCGACFSAGLISFCRAQPRPWLAMTIAIPYLVIVVAMGYSRQAVAIGFCMFALVHLGRGENAKFAAYVILAALFHKTAIVLVPIAILATTQGRAWTAVWVGITSFVLYVLLVQEHEDHLIKHYIESEVESDGASIRIAMNAVPAFLYLLYRDRFEAELRERKLWTWMAIIGLAFVPLLLVSPSSTAVDRLALYLIPLQLYVLSRLPSLQKASESQIAAVGVIVYYAIIQYVWLNYSNYADSHWIPYRFYPFEAWT